MFFLGTVTSDGSRPLFVRYTLAENVRQRYSRTNTKYSFKYIDEFRQYEKEAREAEREKTLDLGAKEEIQSSTYQP